MRRAFGRGRAISLFSLGTMRALGSVDQMAEVLEAAVQAGINHLETAPAYGPAERFLGQALQNSPHRPTGDWVITSKLLPGVSLQQGKRQLQGILERLQVQRIDNLAIHGINRPEHLAWAQSGEGRTLLEWALDSGLVDQVGFSSHGSQPLISAALEVDLFTFCSLHVHLLDPQRLPLAQQALQRGMGVLAISPADKGGRLQAPSAQLIEDCSPMAPLELAYRYLLAQGISSLTLGAAQRSDLAVASRLAERGGPLNIEEQQCIQTLQQRRAQRLGNDLCGQCQACLPCPSGVPIPELLRLRNLLLGHDLIEFTQERYNLIGRAGHWWEELDASACNGCGDCLPRCPHHLPIPELLADTHARLKAAPRRRLWG